MGRIWTELTTLCVLVAVVNLKAKDTQGQHTLANTSITALYVGQKCKCIRIRLKLQLETNRKENDMGEHELIALLEIAPKERRIELLQAYIQRFGSLSYASGEAVRRLLKGE